MTRIPVPAYADVPAASKPVLDAVQKQLGVIPNLFRLVANSPAALSGFASFSGALGKTLDVKTRERIALAVAQVNGDGMRPVAHLPPVTSRNVPVMKEASVLASHRIARATSSG